jgi:protein mago nashi
VRVSPLIIEQMKQIIVDSAILSFDDSDWPAPDVVGRQEMELVMTGQHVKLVLAKIGSMGEMEDKGQSGEGLKTFYFLVQDLRALVFSLISLHFKVKPI